MGSQWTPKEDDDLLKYHDEFGDKWALIARKLDTNRTDCYCRQRYKALIKKRKRKERYNKNKNKNTVDLTNDDVIQVTPKRNKRKRKRNMFVVPDDDDEDPYYLEYAQPKKKKQKKSNKKKKVNKEIDNRYTYNPAMHPIVPSVLDLLPVSETRKVTDILNKKDKKKKNKKT